MNEQQEQPQDEPRIEPIVLQPDIHGVIDNFVETMRLHADDLIEGARQDVVNFVHDITTDISMAAAYGDDELTEELRGQLEIIAELNRVRLSASAWDMLFSATGALMSGIGIGLGALARGVAGA